MANAAIAPLAAVGQVTPNWLPDDRFWYRNADGHFMLVDPVHKTRVPAFDQAKLAAALSPRAGTTTRRIPCRSRRLPSRRTIAQ